ncbi:MAG TPA: helix-turn-helix transcriptional regulator [Pirellulaceae bacterium]|jgi:transcriptional regulator with XRE-family HTH domain
MSTLSRREFGAATSAAAASAAFASEHDSAVFHAIHDPDEDGIERVFVGDDDGFSERLCAARESRGLSIEQCAHAIDPDNQSYWYSVWYHMENGGTCGDTQWMDIWPTIEALVGVPTTTLLYGGSELAIAKDWVKTRLEDFEAGDVTADAKACEQSQRIKEAREWRGLSVADAAAKVGVTERHWQHYENGGWPQGVIEFLDIVKVLNIEFNWLLTGKPADDQTYPKGHRRPIPPAISA